MAEHAATSSIDNHCLKPRAQEQAWRSLVVMSEALPQSLILIGPAGVGKKRSVKALFQLLHCSKNRNTQTISVTSLFGTPEPMAENAVGGPFDEPCGSCASCRKIAEGRHPDLIEILPRGENIAVDDLREMKKSLYFEPMEGSLRFVLIDDAHKLNAASANTLLKTLEEPPGHTRFFLVTHERGLLLPTIISRSQFVHFSPIAEDVLLELLEKNGFDLPERIRRVGLTLLSGGLERAALLTSEKATQFIESIERALVASNPRWEEITQLADQLAAAGSSSAGADDWKLELLLDLIVLFSHRNALAGRTRDEALRFVNRALDAAYLRRRLGRNANKKLIALAASDLAMGGRMGRFRS